MSETPVTTGTAAAARATDDLSALAWVHGELRRSLEAAHKSLRRYLRDAEAAAASDVDAVDPAVLRSARNQLHQGVGALELVGLPAVAQVLRASESAVQRMVTRPQTIDVAAVETIERVSFALLDFLGRQLAGKPVSPVMLFPQYRAALQLAAADRVHPADLWRTDWRWHELPADTTVAPRAADDEARGAMETQVLALMREPGPAPFDRMSNLCAELGAGARQSGGADGAGDIHFATLWQLAAAAFEAQARGLLQPDTYTKRIASRLMAQLRMRVRGHHDLGDRLAQDLLFFCSHARPPASPQDAPRLAAVRQAWRLPDAPTADYETPRLGRFDPALMALARKRVSGAKDAWAAVAGGELHRLTGIADQFTLVGESLQRLVPSGEVLAAALQTAVEQTVASNAEPPPALAMEVATGILYLDASLEDGELDHPELAQRVRHLAQRIDDVRVGAEPQPLDVWMEELYRRVSDRQTMGSVVQELRASLSEIEKQIDQYFRDPTQRQVLIPVPAQLSSMRGVFSVLGLTHASQAALHMRDDVDALAQTEVDAQQAIQAGTFDRLADNLGALSFLIDMLSVQPQMAKSLFRFDPVTGGLSAVMGQSERPSVFSGLDEAAPPATAAPAPAPAVAPVPAPQPLSLLEQLQALSEATAGAAVSDAELARRLEPLAQHALAAGRPELAQQLAGARRALDAGGPGRADAQQRLQQAVATLAPPPAPVAPPSAPVPVANVDSLEDDAEMREIFIEEAREVVGDANAALARLAETPDNAGDMTVLRRAFHTLKGSSRMVGLRDFGDAGWACEQLYNTRLANAARMDDPLRAFTTDALAYLADWTEAIADRAPRGHESAAVARAADALRLGHDPVAIEWPLALPGANALPTAPPPVPREAPPPLAEPKAFDGTAQMLLPPDPGAPAALDLPPASMPTEVMDFDFALDAEPAEDAAAEADALLPLAPASSLAERVPGLPQARDLDLGPPAAPGSDAAPAELPDFAFDLDLGEFAEPAPPPAAPPSPPAALDDLPLDAPMPWGGPAPQPDPEATPVPEGETLEIDLDDVGLLFDAPPTGEGAEAPEPAEEPVDEAAEEAFEQAAEDADQGAERLQVADVPEVSELSALSDELAPGDGHDAAAVPPSDPWMPIHDPVDGPMARTQIFEPDAVDAGEGEGGAVAANDAHGDDTADAAADDDQVRIIGPLRISIPLFNIYLNEADELSRRLCTDLAEWSLEHERHPVPESAVARAHSLAGSSATVGYAELSTLARSLEHALMRSHAVGRGRQGEADLFVDVGDEIRRLLHQFAAGFLRPVPPELLERLADHERLPIDALPELNDAIDSVSPESGPTPHPADGDAGGPADAIDAELFPIFEEEAEELLPQLHARLRDWVDRPADPGAPMACMRTLHTLKGGARLAGALRLGEMAHQLEAAIERLVAQDEMQAAELEPLLTRADAMSAAFEALRGAGVAPAAAPGAAAMLPVLDDVVADEPAPAAEPDVPVATAATVEGVEAPGAPAAAASPEAAPEPEPERQAPAAPAALAAADPSVIDWGRFAPTPDGGLEADAAPGPDRAAGSGAVVRVRAGLLDRMVNQAGEVSITRARIDGSVRLLQGSLGELTDSLERMRRQLHDIEIQAETQISSRMEAAKAASVAFDPLEMDRFTRFQELTRFMAESVNDVATLQRSLQRTLQSAEDELAMQARLTRELQDDLLRTRMVEFDSVAERLHRTVRQAARDAGKAVRLDIVGGAIEIDRAVLERMAGPFEHLLRNGVAHGIEPAAARAQAGKDGTGVITLTVAQTGNEVAVDFADDGGGLDPARIRARAVERGLMAPDAQASDDELVQLIFRPGFSTAETVTELAGRGVGLDVVRADVIAMGGRIETHSEPGKGTRFRLLLPLTTAVTQVVLLRCGELQVAVPSPLVEVVRRVASAEIDPAYERGSIEHAGEPTPFYWLAAMLDEGTRGPATGRTQTVVVIRSAAQRVAVHVDEVLGNQEVVVKNVGPQLSRLPGLAGVTLLPSGAVALIYNPVALAAVYDQPTRRRMHASAADTPPLAQTAPASRAPMVMVVDDSLTVRRVTQRLLVREGYRVVTAKDGLEALERLAEERPVVLLSDIEMPRMDGFDLLRNVRADAKLAGLPVVMITSRTAQKHRDYAAELGADHYLGKPYAEEELLALVARYAGADILG